VAYRPNLPGHISVFNVNRAERKRCWRLWDVAGGQFVPAAVPMSSPERYGRDVLRIGADAMPAVGDSGVRSVTS